MKRGTSGHSFVVAVDKPVGLSSHDVVNRCRRIFGEKRVGHMGTLDPAASGVLPICVGPATRLNPYLSADDKTYETRVAFGRSTTTDDAQGETLSTRPVPGALSDEEYASRVVKALVGRTSQMPPLYSAIKVDGVKAYEAARNGGSVELVPRDIEVYDACLLGVGFDEETGELYWDIRFSVSKGTYIRSLARDLGLSQGNLAYVSRLRRTKVGTLDSSVCVSLEVLENDSTLGRVDPLALLEVRFCYVEGPAASRVENGVPLDAEGVTWYRVDPQRAGGITCNCSGSTYADDAPFSPGEIVGIVAENKLIALYEFDPQRDGFRSRCGFSQGVTRGCNV